MIESLQIVDFSIINELTQLDQSPNFLSDIFQSGLDQVIEALPNLHNYAKADDKVNYKQLIHYLKGALVTIGLSYIAQICFEVLSVDNFTQEDMYKWNEALKDREAVTKEYLIHELNYDRIH